ncbi:MFS transporter [Pseudalkalibacillus hwajinpoensis]|uniref:MFS transporter n=1 Tax=Guptibacillus hwajinpoensis TaxID=208199 RepID=UPI00325C3306
MRYRSYRFLLLGQAFANIGDVLYIVALIAVLYQATGSAIYLSLLPLTITIARFISGMCAPVVLNYFSLKGILVRSQGGKTLLLGVLGSFLSQFSVPISVTLSVVFMIAFLDGWAAPARNAMLPVLVEESELAKANSFVSVLDQTIHFGGWAAGGILVSASSGSSVIWITFVVYAISSVMMAMIKNEMNSKKQSRIPMFEGWRTIWNQPVLRTVHAMIFLEAIANVVWIAAILYLFVNEILQKSEAWWGYLNASLFIGLIIGGVVVSRNTELFEKNMKVILFFSTLAVSVITFIFGLNSVPVIAILLLTVLSGIVEQTKSLVMITFIQKNVQKHRFRKCLALRVL